jgi:methionine-rich copper-binding protein CopC
MSRNQPIRAWGLAAAVMLLSVTLAAQASAHAKLASATPAAKEMAMPAPSELRLKFSEAIELKFAKVTLTGPGKAKVATGPAKLAADDETTLIVPLTAPIPDGEYTVDWQVVAKDGHKTKGAYVFTSMQ